jgi:transcriptional regulator with XRE-family HTH domain
MEAKDKIKKHIAEVGISQSKLAELSGLAFGTINRILNGKQELLPNTLAKIAEALNLSVSQLMQDEAVEVMDAEVQGYIEYDGEIRKIKSFAALQKLVAQIEYETKVLPKVAKGIVAENKANRAAIKSNNLNEQYNFNLDWNSIDDYDATKYDCWSFKTADDEKDGVLLDLGNQCSGYPFSFHDHIFQTSESAYLCGQFSMNTEECKRIQYQLLYERNGYTAKKKVKNANRGLIRDDWEEIMADWMLYVVWNKCKGNEDFANKLKAIPKNAILLENSTTIHEGTSIYWGSKNEELEAAKEKVARYAELQYMKKVRQGKIKKNQSELDEAMQAARNEIHYIGTFSGGNNLMGKILKRCQIALFDGVEPNINYDLFREKQIYLFGELLAFDDKK